MAITTPDADFLREFPWEETARPDSFEGRFEWDGIHYRIERNWDELDPTSEGMNGTYATSASSENFYGDRRTGRLWGPWQEHHDVFHHKDHAQELATSLSIVSGHPDREVETVDYNPDVHGNWRVENRHQGWLWPLRFHITDNLLNRL